jgi:hypothetical protein
MNRMLLVARRRPQRCMHGVPFHAMEPPPGAWSPHAARHAHHRRAPRSGHGLKQLELALDRHLAPAGQRNFFHKLENDAARNTGTPGVPCERGGNLPSTPRGGGARDLQATTAFRVSEARRDSRRVSAHGQGAWPPPPRLRILLSSLPCVSSCGCLHPGPVVIPSVPTVILDRAAGAGLARACRQRTRYRLACVRSAAGSPLLCFACHSRVCRLVGSASGVPQTAPSRAWYLSSPSVLCPATRFSRGGACV